MFLPITNYIIIAVINLLPQPFSHINNYYNPIYHTQTPAIYLDKNEHTLYIPINNKINTYTFKPKFAKLNTYKFKNNILSNPVKFQNNIFFINDKAKFIQYNLLINKTKEISTLHIGFYKILKIKNKIIGFFDINSIFIYSIDTQTFKTITISQNLISPSPKPYLLDITPLDNNSNQIFIKINNNYYTYNIQTNNIYPSTSSITNHSKKNIQKEKLDYILKNYQIEQILWTSNQAIIKTKKNVFIIKQTN